MVIVGFGRTLPDGAIPVFSVDTEEEAQRLITAACPTNVNGDYVAPELVHEQTLENLYLFSDRLDRFWKLINKRRSKL